MLPDQQFSDVSCTSGKAVIAGHRNDHRAAVSQMGFHRHGDYRVCDPCRQLGDGISNIFTPTSGYLMASLAMAKIPYEKWAKFILPLIGIWYAMGAVFVAIAHIINLGPF